MKIKDELSHVRLYQKILSEYDLQSPIFYQIMDSAVHAEIEWSQHIIGDKILGMTPQSIEKYVKYLANTRLRAVGLEPLYADGENCFKHLEKIADTGKEASVKANFFDSSVTSYQMATAVNGWDEF